MTNITLVTVDTGMTNFSQVTYITDLTVKVGDKVKAPWGKNNIEKIFEVIKVEVVTLASIQEKPFVTKSIISVEVGNDW